MTEGTDTNRPITITVRELGELLGLKRDASYALAQRIGFRCGKRLLIGRQELAAFMATPVRREHEEAP